MEKQLSTFSVIPTEIIINKELSSTNKLLYAIISSLTNEKGYCWASNKYLGEMLDISERQIIKNIIKLEKENLIKIDIKDNWKRKITLKNIIVGMNKSSQGVEQKFTGVGTKVHTNKIIEKDKDNILLADKSAIDKEPINKGETTKPSLSELYAKMGMPKPIKACSTQWQDEALNAVNILTGGKEKTSSIFKCYKDNQQKARIALSDCKELGQLHALYFLKVYNAIK